MERYSHMKKVSAVLLSLLVLLTGVLAVPAFSSAAIPFEGSGTEADPYLISSSGELELLSDLVSGGEAFSGVFFALSCDIDLAGVDFEPIGPDAARPFAGSFSGNGFAIHDLTVDSMEPYAALFGVSKGDISRVKLVNACVSGMDWCAGVVAYGACSGCEVSGEISGADHVGGVAGEGAAYNCVSRASVRGANEVGGVIGTGDAYGSSYYGSALGRTYVSQISGVGADRDCGAFGDATELGNTPEPKAKHSVALFIRWALTHIDPASIPTGASLYLPTAYCGTQPWKYLFGSVRAPINSATLNNFYTNNYGQYMLRSQYDDATSGWSTSTYATDCQGLLDAWLTYEEHETTDMNVEMNYTYWCTGKGTIESVNRPWVVGEAVFVYSRKLQRMGHIGWICGYAEDGEPLVVEAKGLMFGVRVTRLSDGRWTHRGLMTVKFYYDAYMDIAGDGYCAEDAYSPVPDTAGTPRAIWSGGVAENYAGGTGTASDPYLIANGEQLALLTYTVSWGNPCYGQHFKLIADIWLNDTTGWQSWDYFIRPQNEWIPIGRYINQNVYRVFKGSFDGGGHTVYGLYVSKYLSSFAGLFGYVGGNSAGYIKNVTVARSYIESVDNVGGIVGYVYDYGRIENCSSSARISGDHFIGGICGYAVGVNVPRITGCENTGDVRGDTDVGGILGCARDNIIVTECTLGAGGSVRGYERIGGIVGSLKYSNASKCRSNGGVTGVDMVGGIAGQALGAEISECYLGHDIAAHYRIGGIVGCANGGSVSDCFSTGDIYATENAGGLAGYCRSLAISRCYNIGTVSALRKKGGAAGDPGLQTTFVSVYVFLGSCPGGNSYGTPVSAAVLASQAGYPGFDFTGTWVVDGASGYPYAGLIRVPYTSALIPVLTDPAPTPAPTPTPVPTPVPTPLAPPELTLPGDADGDWEVTLTDALLVLRSSMGILNNLAYPYLMQGDVDGDMCLTLNDALVIFRIALEAE